MTSYKLQAIIPPSLVAREKKEQRRKVLAAVRARRKIIYRQFQKKMQLQANSNIDTIAELI